jgi:hypothetical protein
MGLINAAFAPFILLYLMMYSFFRYFEVHPLLFTQKVHILTLLPDPGVPQEPVVDRLTTVHAARAVEVPRV